MRVSRDVIRHVVEHRYADVLTERQKENMIAAVQGVLDVTQDMHFSAEVHGVAAAACQRQIYEDNK